MWLVYDKRRRGDTQLQELDFQRQERVPNHSGRSWSFFTTSENTLVRHMPHFAPRFTTVQSFGGLPIMSLGRTDGIDQLRITTLVPK